jgi:hypothetical protein
VPQYKPFNLIDRIIRTAYPKAEQSIIVQIDKHTIAQATCGRNPVRDARIVDASKGVVIAVSHFPPERLVRVSKTETTNIVNVLLHPWTILVSIKILNGRELYYVSFHPDILRWVNSPVGLLSPLREDILNMCSKA